MARSAQVVWAVALVSLLVTAASGGAEPKRRMPSPALRRPSSFDAVAINAACVRCHADVAAEWNESGHRRAYVDAPFQRALALEPLPFCRGCHAPEAPPEREPPASLASLGVACVTCHVVDGIVLAAPRDSTSKAPHPVWRDARFASVEACRGCHEFPFPDEASSFTHRGAPMQATLSEHEKSPYSSDSCAHCHMPTSDDSRPFRRAHQFSASRDEAWLKNSIEVTARVDLESVELALVSRQVGHAFPTGDLFRRIAIVLEPMDQNHGSRASVVRYLTRHPPETTNWSLQLTDDRIQPDARPVVVRIPFDRLGGASIRWRVWYQRVEHPVSNDENESIVEGEILLAEGALSTQETLGTQRETQDQNTFVPSWGAP